MRDLLSSRTIKRIYTAFALRLSWTLVSQVILRYKDQIRNKRACSSRSSKNTHEHSLQIKRWLQTAQPLGSGTVHRWGPSHIEAHGELLSIQSSFELEHCLFPGLFSMISQQSAITHGPGLLLWRNSTYDISLLQRGQSLSGMGFKKSRWKSLGASMEANCLFALSCSEHILTKHDKTWLTDHLIRRVCIWCG